jgi:hypothetical protein
VKVYSILENSPDIGVAPFAITDDNGNFVLRRLPPGQNRLFPVFTEAGYPDGRSGIFAGEPSLYDVVSVEPGRTLTGVVIRLPKKGALFRAHIIDMSTGKPVLTARIHITRADVPGVFYESGPNLQGRFEIVLVPNVPFRVEIRAVNYEQWRYSEMDSQGNETLNLMLKPETAKEMTVKLQTTAQAHTQQ